MTSPRAEASRQSEPAAERQEHPGSSISTTQLYLVPAPGTDRRIRQLVTALKADPGRAWPLAELAAAVRLSPRQLERLFREQTGFTPKQYLRLMRLEEARRMLETSLASVKEIAASVGYRAESHHFERDFRRRYGLTPGACRERQ